MKKLITVLVLLLSISMSYGQSFIREYSNIHFKTTDAYGETTEDVVVNTVALVGLMGNTINVIIEASEETNAMRFDFTIQSTEHRYLEGLEENVVLYDCINKKGKNVLVIVSSQYVMITAKRDYVAGNVHYIISN